MANNQMQVYQGMVFGELSPQDVTTIRETIGKDCNESQFKLFMSIAKASGANPVMNEIYPTVRSGQLTVQFGVDFYVRKSKESEGYRGYDVQLVHENDEFQMHQERVEDEDRYFAVIDKHSWSFPRGKVIGGYAMAYRDGYKPFTVTMEADEVDHFKRSNIGMQKTMWTNYFNDMFKKHMVRRALKAAYDLNFDDEQLESGDVPEYQQDKRERRDITPNQDTIDQQPQQQEEPSGNDPTEQLRQEMKKSFKALGITTKEGMEDYLNTNAPNRKNPMTESDLVGILELMDMHLDIKEAQASDDELPE